MRSVRKLSHFVPSWDKFEKMVVENKGFSSCPICPTVPTEFGIWDCGFEFSFVFFRICSQFEQSGNT